MKRNRRVEYDLADVLDLARTCSFAGHPHDYIEDDAKITLRCTKSGRPKVVIEWTGFPTDDPEYGRNPGA